MCVCLSVFILCVESVKRNCRDGDETKGAKAQISREPSTLNPILQKLCTSFSTAMQCVIQNTHLTAHKHTHIHRLAGSHLFASQSFSPGLAAAHFSGAPIMTVKSISKTAYYVHRLYCEFSFTSK